MTPEQLPPSNHPSPEGEKRSSIGTSDIKQKEEAGNFTTSDKIKNALRLAKQIKAVRAVGGASLLAATLLVGHSGGAYGESHHESFLGKIPPAYTLFIDKDVAAATQAAIPTCGYTTPPPEKAAPSKEELDEAFKNGNACRADREETTKAISPQEYAQSARTTNISAAEVGKCKSVQGSQDFYIANYRTATWVDRTDWCYDGATITQPPVNAHYAEIRSPFFFYKSGSPIIVGGQGQTFQDFIADDDLQYCPTGVPNVGCVRDMPIHGEIWVNNLGNFQVK